MCNCNYPKGMLYSNMPTVKYCDSFDSYYCEKCDFWMHSACKCKADECMFTGRSDKPSEWYGLFAEN